MNIKDQKEFPVDSAQLKEVRNIEGKTTEPTSNQLQFLIYENGSVEKNITLDEYEEFMLIKFQAYNFRDFDNSYYQYRLGLFDEHNWQAYQRIIKTLLEDKYVQRMLATQLSNFSEEFQSELKSLQEESN